MSLHFNKELPLLFDRTRINYSGDFYSTDTEQLFKKNVKVKKDWRWKDAHIPYKFNSLGYRTKEINEADKEFVLGFGCSFTEGVGIDSKDTWLHTVCSKIGIDYINLAKASTGMDIQYYNTLLWNNSNLPRPKYVICQWPQKFRKSFGFNEDDRSILFNDMSETPTHDGKWYGKRYIMDTGEMTMNTIAWYEGFNNTWKSLGVPVLNFSWEYDLLDDTDFLKHELHVIDPEGVGSMQARDCQHDGPEFHEITAKKLLALNVL